MAPAESIPSFNPKDQESIAQIPERFLAEGYLGLTKYGTWLIQGEPITNPKMCRFLLRQLRRTAEGEYWIVNGPQRVLVKLQDTPYLVTGFDLQHPDSPLLYLNDQTSEPIPNSGFEVDLDDVIYTSVKKGQAGANQDEHHRARLQRSAVAQLADVLEEASGGFQIRIGNAIFPIRKVVDG